MPCRFQRKSPTITISTCHRTTSNVAVASAPWGNWQTCFYVKVHIPTFSARSWKVYMLGSERKSSYLKRVKYLKQKMKVFHLVHFGSCPPLWQPENGLLLEAVVCIFTFLAWQYIFLSCAACCPDWRNMTTVLQLSFACTYMLWYAQWFQNLKRE